jgi:hypothetical protein
MASLSVDAPAVLVLSWHQRVMRHTGLRVVQRAFFAFPFSFPVRRVQGAGRAWCGAYESAGANEQARNIGLRQARYLLSV